MIKAIQGRINRIIRNNPFKLEESVLNMHACSGEYINILQT